MDLLACTGSFFLGGVSALLIMGLLYRFLHHPRRVRDDLFLREIADALLSGPESQKPAGRLEVAGAETVRTHEMRSEMGGSPGHPGATSRLGMAYTPASELH